MAIFSNRGTTPMDEREQALNAEIERLEREIALLKERPDKTRGPRLDPGTTNPAPANAASVPGLVSTSGPETPLPASAETPVPPVPLPPAASVAAPGAVAPWPKAGAGMGTGAGTAVGARPAPSIQDPRYNELGERKFDVGQWWQGLRGRFHRDVVRSNNPEMVKYLATGSVQGLRPLRFERRIARNRTLGLVAVLLVVLYGLAWVFLRR